MKEPAYITAKILENKGIAPEIFSIKLTAPEIAKTARAGQFVMVYLGQAELLLPRPISICSANSGAGIIELVYQVVGKGTAVMSEMRTGRDIKLLGPLGNGFFTDGKNDGWLNRPVPPRAAIVGGGIGVPPLYFLAKALKNKGIRSDIFLGFRSAPILVDKFCEFADSLYIASEDGSFGHYGRVTEIVKNFEYDEVFACGPLPLLKAVAEFSAKENIPCQISMEERMACGIGSCVGCAVKSGGKYVRCCCEGPVFYSDELDFKVDSND